ncbi:MAG TPA: alpha/beta hydrolase [Candidatus Angelobacter sp.]|nr:alpha/beta hydrolase [Candidatus Angelobacter sp.]
MIEKEYLLAPQAVAQRQWSDIKPIPVHANLLRSANPSREVTNLINLIFAFLLLTAILPAQTVPYATGVAHTEQVDLGYETYGTKGTGLPIIAINGGPGLSHAYMMQNDLWERVGRNRFVVLYDQRGTGASKRMQAGASQTMGSQVADLDAVRQALGLNKVALLGDSYGGLVAMAYASVHPEHVAKLILSDSPGPSWHDIVHLLSDVFPDIQEQGAQEEKKLGATTEAAARAGLRNHFRMIFYSPEKRDAYMGRMGDLGFEPAIGDAVEKATADLDLTSKLAGFKFPTLVINGRYDMNVAPLTAWRLAHAIPGAKVVFFEKSGHLPAYEEPDKYIEVLEGFLNGQ